MSHKRIHIIGGPASGKSYAASLISEKYSLPILDLDTIFWDNRASEYGIKADPLKRDMALNTFLNQDAWIVEGVYYAWLAPGFRKADLIVALTSPLWLRDLRIFWRFLERKLGFIPSKKKETFKGLFELVKWNHGYDSKNLKQARAYIAELGRDVNNCKNATDVLELVVSRSSMAKPVLWILRT